MINKNELKKLIAKSLNVNVSKINDKTKDVNLEEWDSLGQLSIISALDKKFKGEINFKDIAQANSIKLIEAYLKKKKVLK